MSHCGVSRLLGLRVFLDGSGLVDVGFDFFIGGLLRQSNRLRLLVAHLDPQPAAGRRDAQIPVAKAPHQVKGFASGLFERQALRVGLHAGLDRGAHMLRRPEESICGDEPSEPLVRALKVVGVHEEAESALAIGKVGEDRATQKLLP
jgi:hypothetical protein